MKGCRDPSAPGNEIVAFVGIDRNDGGIAQQAAEFHPVPGLSAGCGNDTHSGGFLVDHADGRLVGDDAGDGGGAGVPGDRDHVKAHGTDAGHGFQFLKMQRAAAGRLDHSDVFADRDKGAGQTAHMVAGHDAALFHGIIEQGKGCGGAGGAGGLQPHFRKNMGHGIAPGRGGSQREVHDSKGDVQALGSFPGHQLAHTGDLEGGALDGLRHHVKGFSLDFFKGFLYHAGAGNTHVDDRFRLSDAAEGTGHEGIVLHGIGENHQFGAAQAVLIPGQLGGFDNDLAHFPDGVHVDARPGGGNVDGGTEPLRLGQNLRDGFEQSFVCPGGTLLHHGGVAADEVDAGFIGCPVKGSGDGYRIPLGDEADRGDGYALVDNGYAQLSFQIAAHLHQMFCGSAYLIVYARGTGFRVPVGAVQEIDAQRDGPDIEILLLDHMHGLQDFTRFDHVLSLPYSSDSYLPLFFGSDPVHGVKDVHALYMDRHPEGVPHALKRLVDVCKFHMGAVNIHHHHHGEVAVQNGLGDVQNVDIHLRQLGGDLGNDARGIKAGDRNQGFGHFACLHRNMSSGTIGEDWGFVKQALDSSIQAVYNPFVFLCISLPGR